MSANSANNNFNKVEQMDNKKLCIQACLDAHRACQETALHLCEQGQQVTENLVRLLLDCAAISQASADFMRGNSELQGRFCEATAQISLRCAQECERLDHDMQLKYCATLCRRCASHCQALIAKPVAAMLQRTVNLTDSAEKPSLTL